MKDTSAALNAPTWERWVREKFPRGLIAKTTTKPNAAHLPPWQVLELTRVWSDGRADVVHRGLPLQLQPGEWEFIKKEATHA